MMYVVITVYDMSKVYGPFSTLNSANTWRVEFEKKYGLTCFVTRVISPATY